MTDIINNVAKSNRNLDRLDVLFNGDDTATYTDENGNTRGSLSHQIKDVQASEVQLVDFEQGDWSPSVEVFHSSANPVTKLRYAKYSVIRDVVSLTCQVESVQFMNYPTGGHIGITGLPFPPSANIYMTRAYFGEGLKVPSLGVPYFIIEDNNLLIEYLSAQETGYVNANLATQDTVHNFFCSIKYLRQST